MSSMQIVLVLLGRFHSLESKVWSMHVRVWHDRPRGAGLPFGISSTFRFPSVLTRQFTPACDADCCTKRLCDEMITSRRDRACPRALPDARTPTRRTPINTCGRSKWTPIRGPGIRDRCCMHPRPSCSRNPCGVMSFDHLAPPQRSPRRLVPAAPASPLAASMMFAAVTATPPPPAESCVRDGPLDRRQSQCERWPPSSLGDPRHVRDCRVAGPNGVLVGRVAMVGATGIADPALIVGNPV